MALITRTVGDGGNHTDWATAYQWLYDQSQISALTDHYVLNGISDTDHVAYPNVVINCNLNGGIIEFNGNGYKVCCHNTDGILLQVSNAAAWSILSVHNFVIEMDGGGGGGDGTYGIRISCTPRTYIGTGIYNCFLYNLDPSNEAAALDPGNRLQFFYPPYWTIYNCIAYGFSTGLSRRNAATIPGTPGHSANIIENCRFFNCGFGGTGYWGGANGYALNGGAAAGPQIDPIAFRNVDVLRNDGITGRDSNVFLAYPAYPAIFGLHSSFTNCATSDANTFAALASAFPNQVTDCLDGLVASDHLHSTTLGNAHFLKTKRYNGIGLDNGGVVPTTPTHDYDGVAYAAPYPIGPYMPYDFDYRLRVIPDPDRGVRPLKVNFGWEIDEIYS